LVDWPATGDLNKDPELIFRVAAAINFFKRDADLVQRSAKAIGGIHRQSVVGSTLLALDVSLAERMTAFAPRSGHLMTDDF
jgi:hypothetical protein